MDRDTKLSIATLMIAALTIGTDLTGALLLVPRIENEFSADITTAQWVLNLYALTYAVFMVAGGRLGDMYGRRRLMLVSLGIFVVTSAACMVSPSIGWLIGARALQGFGAGILWPSLSTNALLVPSIFLGFLYFPQFLQKVLGWSVLESSFGMLPMMVLLSVGSIVSGRFYDSVGPKRLLLIGYAGITVGSAWVVALMPSWGYLALFPAMLLLGFGAALAVGSAGTVAVSAVAPERAGLAGALAFTVHLTLGAVGGTAIMYASSFSSLRQGLMASGIDMSPADQAAINAAASGSDAVREVFDKVGPATAETIHAILTGGFVDGLRHAYWLALAAAIVGIVAVVALDERKLKNVGGGKS